MAAKRHGLSLRPVACSSGQTWTLGEPGRRRPPGFGRATDEGPPGRRLTALTAGQTAASGWELESGTPARAGSSASAEGDRVMKTIDDFEVAGQRVLVRDDLNVPL